MPGVIHSNPDSDYPVSLNLGSVKRVFRAIEERLFDRLISHGCERDTNEWLRRFNLLGGFLNAFSPDPDYSKGCFRAEKHGTVFDENWEDIREMVEQNPEILDIIALPRSCSFETFVKSGTCAAKVCVLVIPPFFPPFFSPLSFLPFLFPFKVFYKI